MGGALVKEAYQPAFLWVSHKLYKFRQLRRKRKMKIKRILTLAAVIVILISMTGILSVGAAPSGASATLPYLAGTAQTYVVLYKANAVSSDAATVISNAGGSLVYSYDKIGVVIARSDNELFRSNLMRDKRIEGASFTSGFGVQIDNGLAEEALSETFTADQLNASPIDDEPLGWRQWDMRQIHVPEAHAITTGSPTVVVGDIDTGIDYTHPDLAPNIDFTRSVGCIGGVPDQNPDAWFDNHFHGTHTAGTIAAADNALGMIGVAPNVKIAAIKAGNDDGYFFPEAVICAFMWAAEHDIDVTNNSYFADPWLFNCRNDPEQRAIWKAEQRAIRYAMSQGVVVVAAQGNENIDLSKRNIDTISPDYPPGSEQEREVTNACVVIPVEISGVVGVTANGYFQRKAYYSSYGVGVAQLTAPGGDNAFQRPQPVFPSGSILSTIPYYYCVGGPGTACYGSASGTSMASPHVAGVAALILSQFGKMPPGAVQAKLTSTALSIPCPPNPFDPSGTGDLLATCVGGDGYNGFFGHGQVDAFNAVTHTP
jgi:subtilisin family serine protease